MSDPTSDDRIMQALRELIRAEIASLVYLGRWEYQVTAATATSFSGRPTSGAFPLPDLVDVPVRPSVSGAVCVPQPASLVTIAFANGDPTRPELVSYDATLPLSCGLDATLAVSLGATAPETNAGDALGAVLRDGDTVSIAPGNGAGVVAGVVTFVSSLARPDASRLKA